MDKSNTFLLIVILAAVIILVAAALAVFTIYHSQKSFPVIQGIKLPNEKIFPSQKGRKIEKIRQEIKTMSEGKIIKYREESFYPDRDFSKILENEEDFKNQLIDNLNKTLSGVEIRNLKFSLNSSKKSVTLNCDILEAMYNNNSYNMHFILEPLGLDLWRDFQPQHPPYGEKLSFDGQIKGIPTKIVFEFPYELNHCHEHVWPKY